ncbi:hypothetical protein NCIMB2158_590006 [Tenacibaculum maritimum]|uniref:hypothetical protein n=1 Tax=Tenacibaculum maritimum TaxID=107401 RepID=UPI0012E6BF61
MIDVPIGYPYQGSAYFYKRLPNKNKCKVLLFVYLNKEQDCYFPYFELQTINTNDRSIDKLIEVGGKAYECGWDRSFNIDENYFIKIIDKQSCYDFEEEKEIEQIEYLNKYEIDSTGYFKRLNLPNEPVRN